MHDVIRQTDAMYGSYLKGVPLTEAEAEIALAFAKDLAASFEDNQRPVREAPDDFLPPDRSRVPPAGTPTTLAGVLPAFPAGQHSSVASVRP
ncbi:hypothetical protein ACFU5Z_08195 [Streptomyces sp. NPDC057521]|uniref:hypothetical protein n=1 Tax=Streptomyces sp. NPDC057521 TaxID=3346156 RepID=UPI0036CFF1DD